MYLAYTRAMCSTVKNLVVAATVGIADKVVASSIATWSDTPWINNLNVNLANAGSAALVNTAINGGSLADKYPCGFSEYRAWRSSKQNQTAGSTGGKY